MIALAIAAALALQDTPPAAAPELLVPEPSRLEGFVTIDQLPIEQAAAARCAIAYATVSKWQKSGDGRGGAYPDIEAAGGREFFVRTMARLMEEAGLTREGIVDLAFREVSNNDNPEGEARIKAIMPACELMKSASGL
ncbi:MAG: hypothetical protein ACKO1N_00780 [Erythrobacter sp.]